MLTSRLAAIENKYGLQDKSKVREDAIFDMYKGHIKSLREKVGGTRPFNQCLPFCGSRAGG